MDNAWDRAKQLSDKHASAGGIFVRLANDGDTVVGAFCGEPDSREVHWTGDMYADCSGSNSVIAPARTGRRCGSPSTSGWSPTTQ